MLNNLTVSGKKLVESDDGDTQILPDGRRAKSPCEQWGSFTMLVALWMHWSLYEVTMVDKETKETLMTFSPLLTVCCRVLCPETVFINLTVSFV